jgi:tartrate dehydratase beta subunit/fumarate hydratase class I family protein
VLLNTRKERKKDKRVILKGQIIVSRDSIIREVERIDKEAEDKKDKKGKKTQKVVVLSSDSEEKESEEELA